jgi:hypothetical protein
VGSTTAVRLPGRRAAAGGHVVLRIAMPDRPGALGAVASRIGAVGADITDVSVHRRSGGSAVDEFHLTLPRTGVDVLALLVQELDEVDGARIESCVQATCCDLRVTPG